MLNGQYSLSAAADSTIASATFSFSLSLSFPFALVLEWRGFPEASQSFFSFSLSASLSLVLSRLRSFFYCPRLYTRNSLTNRDVSRNPARARPSPAPYNYTYMCLDARDGDTVFLMMTRFLARVALLRVSWRCVNPFFCRSRIRLYVNWLFLRRARLYRDHLPFLSIHLLFMMGCCLRRSIWRGYLMRGILGYFLCVHIKNHLNYTYIQIIDV